MVLLAESDLQVKSKAWRCLPGLLGAHPSAVASSCPCWDMARAKSMFNPPGKDTQVHSSVGASPSRAASREPCAGAQGSLCLQGGTARGFFLLPRPPLCTMGLSSSKAHPKVTRVAPMLSSEDLPARPIPHPTVLGGPILRPPAVGEWGTPAFHGQLPPLRNTSYGRASAGKGQGGGVGPRAVTA